MDKRRLAAIVWVALAVACFVMGVLSFSGVISNTDEKGRVIFGFGWVLIGIGWLGRYWIARKKWQRESEENGDSGGSRGL
jgi:protein-S-isoprenylcysteine O-methyltransferase Ste14